MPLPDLYENHVLDSGELPVHFSVDRFTEEGQITRPHWHEYLEIHYIKKGSADFFLEQQRIQVTAGDMVIVNCNELHTAFSRQHPYEGQVVIFDIRELSDEFAKKNFIFLNHVRQDEAAKELFTQIFQEMAAQDPGYKQLCKALVLELLVHICRKYVLQSLPERESESRKKNLERLHTVLYYLESHSGLPLTVKQLADIACLSVDRFGHLFREGVGKSPLQYLNDLRLRKALSLLKTGEHSVTEAASIVGFKDYNHFGLLFRRRYGCTPNEVRLGKADPRSSLVEKDESSLQHTPGVRFAAPGVFTL